MSDVGNYIIYVVEQRQHCFLRKAVASLQVLLKSISTCLWDGMAVICLFALESIPFHFPVLLCTTREWAPQTSFSRLCCQLACAMRWVIGKSEGGETVPLPSPTLPALFWAASPLWFQLLLYSFSFHDPAPARYPLLQKLFSLGSPRSWNLVTVSPPSGSPALGIKSSFLLILILEISPSLLWLFSSFSTLAFSSPYSVPSLKDLACTCLFSWLDLEWGR